MIVSLIIKNYLFLKDIEIDFSKGFNVITGETGAGKSIMINALNLLLGERADYSIIGKKKDKTIVESIMDENVLIENEYTTQVLRREINIRGTSRCFLNDSPVNVTDLKLAGEKLIDIHSQNEHQSLLKKENHIKILDKILLKESLNEIEKTYNNYINKYEDLKNKISEFEKTVYENEEIKKKKDFLEFQFNEIMEVSPIENEEEKLEKELLVKENYVLLKSSLKKAYQTLYEEENSVFVKIKSVRLDIGKIKHLNATLIEIYKEVENSEKIINELSIQIRNIENEINFDLENTEEIRKRLYKIQFLKKKYGLGIKEIIEKKENIKIDLEKLEVFDKEVKEIKESILSLKEESYLLAVKISKERKKISEKVVLEIEKYFKELGLEEAKFRIEFKITEKEEETNNTIRKNRKNILLTENGIDEIEFYIQVNKGSEFSPLRKTASGGEISRIMLAIKTVIAELDEVKTLIFDEIDTGISGRIARKTGQLLKKLSATHQVIAITHLAQIASIADEHFLVTKKIENGDTITEIEKLDQNKKVIEIAKLLSGEKVTDASIKSAKELMDKK